MVGKPLSLIFLSLALVSSAYECDFILSQASDSEAAKASREQLSTSQIVPEE